MLGGKLIYLVDDEEDIRTFITMYLEKEKYDYKEFGTGQSLFKSLEYKIPDLLLLDLMLPDIDGIEICRRIKSNNELKNIPIIMVTAKSEEIDRVLGLELGADDYMTKPFSGRELLARIKAVLRRTNGIGKEPDKVIFDNLLEIDRNRYEVFVNREKVHLTTTEFRILELLTLHPGWVYSRDKILNHLWGNDKIVVDRTIDVHIRHLREKIGTAGKYIKNIRSIGYKFDYEK